MNARRRIAAVILMSAPLVALVGGSTLASAIHCVPIC